MIFTEYFCNMEKSGDYFKLGIYTENVKHLRFVMQNYELNGISGFIINGSYFTNQTLLNSQDCMYASEFFVTNELEKTQFWIGWHT